MEKSPTVKKVKVRFTRRIPLTEKVCKQCGKDFMGAKLAIYCSQACGKKAAYWRNPDTYRQKRLESYSRQKEQAAK